MRKIVMMLMAMLPMLAWGQENAPVVSAQAGTLSPGGSANLVISLTNEGDDEYNGYQFDLLLPEGITIGTNENGSYTCEFTDRYSSSGITSSIRNLGDGWFRIIVFSLNNARITGSEGPIVNIPLKGSDDLAPGEYTGELAEVVLSRTDGRGIDCEPSEFPITVDRTRMGDVDFNKKVDVTDVMLVVSYVLGDIYPQFHFKYADMDKNGTVDVTDAMMIVDILLDKQ